MADQNKQISNSILLTNPILKIASTKFQSLMFTKVVFLILFVFSSLFVSAQNTDSLELLLPDAKNENRIKILSSLSEAFLAKEPEKSFNYASEIYEIATKNKNDSLKASSLLLLGKARYYSASYDSVLMYWQSSLEVYKNMKDTFNMAELYNNIGVCYYVGFSNYDKAIENYIFALKKREEMNDSVGAAYALNNIGNIYYKQKRRTKALENYKKALAYAENSNDNYILSILLNNLGAEYANLKEYELALKYKFRSLDIKKAEGNKIGEAVTLGSIGSVYKYQKDYTTAEKYYNESIEILRQAGNKSKLATLLNYKAGIYQETGRSKEAILLLSESLKLAEDVADKNLIENCSKELSKVYFSIGKYKEAYSFQEKYIIIHDSIYSSSSDKRLKEAEVKYESEKKQKENELLLQKQEVSNLKLNQQQSQRNYLLILAGLLLVLAGIIFNRYRFKQKTNTILENKNIELAVSNKKIEKSEAALKELVTTKDKFFSIIAHDLRSPLSSLAIVSEMLDGSVSELTEKQLKYYLGSISTAAGGLLSLTENLLGWAQTQTGKTIFTPEKVNIHDIVKENIALLQINAQKKNIIISNQVSSETIAFADINLLTAVIRNLLTNAMKFTPKGGKISVNISLQKEFHEITVADNGMGMNPEDLTKLFKIGYDARKIGDSPEKGTGLGLILCKEFTEINGGKIRAESKEGLGSKFIFTVPKSNEKSFSASNTYEKP